MADEILKQLQLTELSMLLDFDKFCRENNIRYFLTSGTLLGAVRHKGFIPWDDDIDVALPYKEFVKFRKLINKLPDKYFYQDYRTDTNWYRPHAKLRLKNTAMIEKGFTGYDINQGIWIDIFILIGVRNKLDFYLKKRLITVSNYLQIHNFVHNSYYEEFEAKLGKVGIILLDIFSKIPMKVRVAIHRAILSIICTDYNKTKYVSCMWSNITEMYPSEIFKKDPIYLEFEGHKFPCSPDWDLELTINYGDYMTIPPVEDRQIHYSPIIDFNNSYTKYMTIGKN